SYLSNYGFHLIVASNGREAIDLAKAHHPDLILMDIQMPEVDGLEAIRCIRADPELATTPIIALTALAMAGDREKCLAAGATEYFAKPMSLRQLKTVIQQLLTEPR
ncbi:MAG TPA: response regulator, partial [Allocoleopsis sp.]